VIEGSQVQGLPVGPQGLLVGPQELPVGPRVLPVVLNIVYDGTQ
jgi:hypothetical protein